jgi:hypothetical protein
MSSRSFGGNWIPPPGSSHPHREKFKRKKLWTRENFGRWIYLVVDSAVDADEEDERGFAMGSVLDSQL